jgi:hypothetical protein
MILLKRMALILATVLQMSGNKVCHVSESSPLLFPDRFALTAEQFEEDDDPDAGLDISCSATREYEETETSTSASVAGCPLIRPNTNLLLLDSEPAMLSSRGNEGLYANYTLNSEIPTPFQTHNFLT